MSLFETVRTQLGGMLSGASADGERQISEGEHLGGALLDMVKSRGLGPFLDHPLVKDWVWRLRRGSVSGRITRFPPSRLSRCSDPTRRRSAPSTWGCPSIKFDPLWQRSYRRS